MKIQLVLELPAKTTDDFDLLIELENALIETLASYHSVDGHDFGSGTMNIFILTERLDEAFVSSKEVLQAKGLLFKARIMYRYPSEDYIILWPEEKDNLHKIALSLKRIQAEGGDHNFVIFTVGDDEAGYYLQFAGGLARTLLYGEAVSNHFLQEEWKLGQQQIDKLQTLGWQPPTSDKVNFYCEWQAKSSEDRVAIAEMVIKTFTEVYGLNLDRGLHINLHLE
jgi:hypothetical protein